MTVARIIAAWPHPSELAADIGVDGGLIASFKHRDRIPDMYWEDLVAAAQRRGYSWITLEYLASLAAMKRRGNAPSEQRASL
ncbi:hypothetical protein [Nitrospirillum bahiense]|nr:hypothetical protein [Nitrospirillum amazonense]